MSKDDKPEHAGDPAASGTPQDLLRREAMARLAGLSAVSSITVTTLLLSTRASAQSAGLGGPPPPPGGGGGE